MWRIGIALGGWLLIVLSTRATPGVDDPALATAWRPLEAGLELGTFSLPREASGGDSRVRVLRIDPGYYELQLLMASATRDSAACTARQWCERAQLVAAINAAMYQADGRTSTALMVTRGHSNNAHLTRDNSLLLFDPLVPGVAPVRLLDRTCEDIAALRPSYGSQIQGIRMLACDGANTWAAQPRRWSAAEIGLDRQGRVLFLHVRSPYTMHELIEMLRALPLDLVRLQYAEGGPEAQLAVRAGGERYEFVGSYETGFFESDDDAFALPVPNVLGVRRR